MPPPDPGSESAARLGSGGGAKEKSKHVGPFSDSKSQSLVKGCALRYREGWSRDPDLIAELDCIKEQIASWEAVDVKASTEAAFLTDWGASIVYFSRRADV